MSGTKRNLEDISGADDPDDVPLSHIRRRRQDLDTTGPSSLQPMTEDEIAASIKEYSEHRLNHLPLNLMTTEFRDYLFWNSNVCLEQAKHDGASLADVSIGEKCLPIWPGFSLDPEEESLHQVIQSHLMSYEAANEAGKLVREDIIWKSNRKLDEARALGLELENIRIGKNLLPSSDRDMSGYVEEDPVLVDDHEMEETYATEELESSQTIIANSSTTEASAPMGAIFPDSSDSDSDSDTDVDMDDDEEFDDVLSVENLFDVQPYYSDYDDEPNVLHDAEVVGFNPLHSSVDLEVFVAVDEEEYEDLPEIEFAMDWEGFEYWCGSEDTVDVEVDGTQIRCTGELFDIEDVTSPSPVEQMDTQTTNQEDNTAVEEGAGIREENFVVIEETEEGFSW
ncbi:hypothetical protein FALBO_6457 [Fusarium albosuccineum]|uniref:Uncharacterized protein n=1 Tax=Fusarium albosuccineum TaxID=1237068 RepID=A0A8H4PK22_9HYPO|nr:hypothetical protein FALBO_6457 [Fusarium albosuccineum]